MNIVLLTSLAVLLIAITALLHGAHIFVSGAQSLGASLKIKPFIIGVFIVGLGTSLPELVSSLAAVGQGQEQIVLANVVGSNITNILFIGGILALLAGPFRISKNLLRSELPVFSVATIHFVLMVQDGTIDQLEALLLFASLLAYCWYLWSQRTDTIIEVATDSSQPKYRVYDALTLVCAGALITIIGAHYTVSSLVSVAEFMAIPVSVLSIIIIALGTSLPELAVSLQAVRAKQVEMAIGNLFGSNAFNILLVASVPAFIQGLSTAPVVQELGIPVLIGASLMLVMHSISRQLMPWEGALLLLFYGFFLIKLFQFI